MSACRRDTFDDSNTIVLAAVRPSEQLPWIGWRLPSAASSQAPSSWDAFTQKCSTKKSSWTQCVCDGGRERARGFEEALQRLRPPALNFLPVLMMYTLSR